MAKPASPGLSPLEIVSPGIGAVTLQMKPNPFGGHGIKERAQKAQQKVIEALAAVNPPPMPAAEAPAGETPTGPDEVSLLGDITPKGEGEEEDKEE